MKDYIAANKKAYDDTAHEFEQKIAIRVDGTGKVVDLLTKQLEINPSTQPKTILDLGPGSGWEAKLLCDAGYAVTAIEFSEMMAAVAQKTAPKAEVIVDEFTTHNFDGQTFDAIFAMAFIHLFTSEDVIGVMQKMFTLLRPKGVVLISTTLHAKTDEGFMRKTNFAQDAQRYRKQYTESELTNLIKTTGFKVISSSVSDDREVEGKRWINLLVTPVA